MAAKRDLRKNNFFMNLAKNKTLLFMLMPAVIYYFIFSYIPMIGSVVAFKRYNYTDGLFGSPWTGFDNFKFLFANGKIFKVALNTIAYNIAFIIVNQILQIASAIFLSEINSKSFKKVSQSVMFFPYFISWVIVGGFMYNFFNYDFGSLNTLLKSIGFKPVDIYSNAGIWKYIIIAINAWKNVGYGTVVYLASITGIDKELYESAEIDGAGKFAKTFFITLPLMVPQIVILILLSIGNIFRGDFDMFYQVTGNNPLLYDSTDVIDTFVVRSLLQIQDIGMSSAAGLAQSIVCFVILIVANTLVRKYQENYALF
ncbi:sugar ABC transporter permease [Clostridium thermosuccinogenes]|uniref:Sugar ABC transporter permease n=2 Tax=Clostridium thermosuccinogenes TaxID=84032 RepID=A0A2K2FQS7_9CLOT|nr:ABC transporter permease subunit [Pseudoclostridium thermosuccinogenes]AUS96047.1 sugar ABC transporter permease [Pseudoclostridium thermosuccinogenes]PNT99435.1 sugar ABC transporter permease [Pseudoclostridium thermosuccinogenes]PNU01122.1 sugar ABC transporter permease [Pseudoclostridium thermosuccinogenes]